MRDIYTETIVPIAASPVYKVLKYLLYVLIAIAVVLVLYGLYLFLPLGALFAYLLYKVNGKICGEYEYVHTNDVFDIDLVIQNARRKNVISIQLSQVLLVAPIDSAEMRRFSQYRTLNYTGKTKQSDGYAMVFSKNGQNMVVLLQLDANMHKSLKRWIPDKVK